MKKQIDELVQSLRLIDEKLKQQTPVNDDDLVTLFLAAVLEESSSRKQ